MKLLRILVVGWDLVNQASCQTSCRPLLIEPDYQLQIWNPSLPFWKCTSWALWTTQWRLVAPYISEMSWKRRILGRRRLHPDQVHALRKVGEVSRPDFAHVSPVKWGWRSVVAHPGMHESLTSSSLKDNNQAKPVARQGHIKQFSPVLGPTEKFDLGWWDGSVVRSSCYSCRGAAFGSHHPHLKTHRHLYDSSSQGSSALFWLL